MFPIGIIREEDECGAGTGGAYYSASQDFADKEALDKWWNDVGTAMPRFPMYAVFLATDGDAEVTSFVESNRPELKSMSGKTCCFVYFRDEDRARGSKNWSYAEHAALVHPIASIIGIPPNELPCLVFFRHIASGEYRRVDLRGISARDMLQAVREVFKYVPAPSADPFEALGQYKRAIFWKRTKENLAVAAKQCAKALPQLATAFLKMVGHPA